jgi:hypothetical protein
MQLKSATFRLFQKLTNIDQRRLNSEAHAIIALIGIDRY